MDLLKLRQALQCHLGNAVLKRVLPEALDETKVTTPRALAEYLRLPEVSCAPRVPSAEHGRQMRELVELRAKLVDFESFLARVDASLQALGEGDADRAEREKVEPLQHRRREAIALLKTKLLQLESQLRPFGLDAPLVATLDDASVPEASRLKAACEAADAQGRLMVLGMATDVQQSAKEHAINRLVDDILSRWRTGAGTAAGSGEALAGESSEGEASEGEGEDAVLFFSKQN